MNIKTAQLAKKLLLTATVIVMLLPGLISTASAQTAPPAANAPTTPASSAPAAIKGGTVTVDELLYQFNYKGATQAEMAGTKIGAVNALPKSPWTKTLAEIIKMLLNITGGLALLAFTVGGTMMVLSSGNGDLLEKGKNVTITAIAGLVIIAVSYALVIGVSELQFLSGGGGGTEAAVQTTEQLTPGTTETSGEQTSG